MPIQLPLIPKEVNKNVQDYSWLVYGKPGLGKSTFASFLDHALILDSQDGYKHLSARVLRISSWEELLETLAMIMVHNKEKPADAFQAIVFDVVDDFIKMSQDYICQRKGVASPAEANDYGATWTACGNEFRRVIDKAKTIAVPYFISHDYIEEIENQGIKLHVMRPSCFKKDTGRDQFNTWLRGITDCIAYIGFNNKNERRMYLEGNEFLTAKNRLSATGIEIPKDGIIYDRDNVRKLIGVE